MSDAFENAAIAFDQDAGVPAARSSSARGSEANAPVETMFDNLGGLEIDEESPAHGGGDNLPLQSKKPDSEDAPDEDNLEEAGEEEDAGEETPEEEQEEEEKADDPVYEVMIDGKPAEVPLSEALAGYIRQETFHQRLGALEGVKTQLRVEASKVVEDRTRYVDLIEEVKKHLDSMIPPEPNWKEEYKRDPDAAAALQERFEQLKGIKAKLDEQKTRTQKEQEAAQIDAYKAWSAEEDAKVMANNPRWRDPVKGETHMKEDLTSMMRTGLSAGFTKEEINSARDSRMITILLKAAKYDRIVDRNPKPVRKGNAKPVNSGAVPIRSGAKGGNKALKALQKTGSVEAAGDFFTQLITKRK